MRVRKSVSIVNTFEADEKVPTGLPFDACNEIRAALYRAGLAGNPCPASVACGVFFPPRFQQIMRHNGYDDLTSDGQHDWTR